jgi:hypothetical protein
MNKPQQNAISKRKEQLRAIAESYFDPRPALPPLSTFCLQFGMEVKNMKAHLFGKTFVHLLDGPPGDCKGRSLKQSEQEA